MAKEDPPTDKQLAYAYDLALKLSRKEQSVEAKKIKEAKTRDDMAKVIRRLRFLAGI